MSEKSDGIMSSGQADERKPDKHINDELFTEIDDDDLNNYVRPLLQCSKYGIGVIDKTQQQYITIQDEVATEQFALSHNTQWRDYLTYVTQFDDILLHESQTELSEIHQLIQQQVDTINNHNDSNSVIELPAIDTAYLIDSDTLNAYITHQQQLEQQRQELEQYNIQFTRARQTRNEQRIADKLKQQQNDHVKHMITNELINDCKSIVNSPVKSVDTALITEQQSIDVQQYKESQRKLQQQKSELLQQITETTGAIASDVVHTEPIGTVIDNDIPPGINTLEAVTTIIDSADVQTSSVPGYTAWLQQVEQYTIDEYARKVAEHQRLHNEYLAAEQAKQDKIELHKKQIAELEAQHRAVQHVPTPVVSTSVSVVVDTAKIRAEQLRLAAEEQERVEEEMRLNECIQMARADLQSRELHELRQRKHSEIRHAVLSIMDQLVNNVVFVHIQYIQELKQAEQQRILLRQNHAAMTIQSCYRRHTAVHKYKIYRATVLQSLHILQRVIRGYICRVRQPYYKQTQRACLLRRLIRHEAATVIQCNWRGHYLRKRLQHIKQWANNTGIDIDEYVAIDDTFYTYRPMDTLFTVQLPEQAVKLLETGLPTIQHVVTQAAVPTRTPVLKAVKLSETGLPAAKPNVTTVPILTAIPPIQPPVSLLHGRTGAVQHSINQQSLQHHGTPVITPTATPVKRTSVTVLPALVHQTPVLQLIMTRPTSTQHSARANVETSASNPMTSATGNNDVTEQLAMQWMRRKQRQIQHYKQKNKHLTADERLQKAKNTYSTVNTSWQHSRTQYTTRSSHSTSSHTTSDKHTFSNVLQPYNNMMKTTTLPLITSKW